MIRRKNIYSCRTLNYRKRLSGQSFCGVPYDGRQCTADVLHRYSGNRSCSTLELIRKIEELRLELNKLAMYKRLADREMLILSQKLDQLLNEYQDFKQVK
ncbi:aspartyl-phosphate phosphatase Spo0E family protein [Paenibacillus antibioticophila]|uniref:aspartyl-phosphate phosphatase Spo0E family protein n=1 Tax=Paenibacillus antibioticophila TaxID=1274374 RepID=UPI0024B4B57D|nr:aspartyl-phosphate phosphatase Spo0E family protein [Paenibacillus antibioticophila]